MEANDARRQRVKLLLVDTVRCELSAEDEKGRCDFLLLEQFEVLLLAEQKACCLQRERLRSQRTITRSACTRTYAKVLRVGETDMFERADRIVPGAFQHRPSEGGDVRRLERVARFSLERRSGLAGSVGNASVI